MLQELLKAAVPVTFPAGEILFREGSQVGNYMFVLDGSVIVRKISRRGREIVLYRVKNGETCVLTANCLLSREPYNAEGMAETDVRAIALSDTAFHSLMDLSAKFREIVFTGINGRISDLIMIIDEIAFHPIDSRLARLLLHSRAADHCLNKTHHELATELGSAREVVSRKLKEFERRGWVSLGRGSIRICDSAALSRLEKS